MSHHVKHPLLLCSVVILLPYLFSSPAASQSDICKQKEIQFAHCQTSLPVFRSVLLAVHGWKGSCLTAFGKTDGSLFRILDRRFFDIDCFEYDSLRLNINENVKRLHERLRLLSTKGYDQVLLVTHSTGGILALRLLANVSMHNGQLASPDRIKPLQTAEGIRIQGINAWATPINGLLGYISFFGRFAEATFSPETLGDLRADSAFLKKLRADLRELSGLMQQAEFTDRGRLHIPITFYHGQEKDGVVADINETEARTLGWWPYEARIVNTESGHTHNVGNAGQIGLPKYPAEITQMNALLSLSLSPRLDDLFPPTPTKMTASLEARQLLAIDGIAVYSREQFLQTFRPLADFLRRIVTDAFERSDHVDARIVESLSRAIQDEAIRRMGREMIDFFDRVVNYIFPNYGTAPRGDLTRFGEGRSTIAKEMLSMLQKIKEAVNDHIKRQPQDEIALSVSGSLEKFNIAVLTVQARLLHSRFPDVRSATLELIAKNAKSLSVDEIRQSALHEQLNRFTARYYTGFASEERHSLSQTYGEVMSRGSDLNDGLLKHLNTEVAWRGASRPLWTALLDNQTVEDILLSTSGIDGPTSTRFLFIREVIARGGATGNGLSAAKTAVLEAQKMLERTPEPTLKEDWLTDLELAGKQSKYPLIQKQVTSVIVGERR